jgi:hypothetical protein
MKDIQTVFDDLSWLYTEPADEHAKRASEMLDTIATEGLMVQHDTAAIVAVLMPMAEALASTAHSLAHAVGLLEVIAEAAAVRP